MTTSTMTMPAQITVPVGVRFTGEKGTVDLAVVAVSQCPNGHLFLEEIPDVSDALEVAGRQARWAEQHAASCNAIGATQPASDHAPAAA